jgi:hypothetical protein
MADVLADLSEPVSDRTLVLNIIRGLVDHFDSVGRHIRLARDFPTFLEARSTLILEDITINERPSSTSTGQLASGGKPSDGGNRPSDRPPAKQ